MLRVKVRVRLADIASFTSVKEIIRWLQSLLFQISELNDFRSTSSQVIEEGNGLRTIAGR